MIKKYYSIISKLLFWLMPIVFWVFWQLILIRSTLFWPLLIISVVIIFLSINEAIGKKLNKYFFIITLDLVILVASFYLFSSLLFSGWWLQLLWFYFVWHLYSYLNSLRNYHLNKPSYFPYFSIYSALVSFFLFSSLLFGLQSFLNLPSWQLLLGIFPLILLNIISIATIQGWNKLKSFWFWLFLTFLSWQFILLLTFLPLSYLVLGVLGVLFYYSIFNFVRLYLIERLTKKKIKNYIIFIMISLLAIFLTARWL